MQSHIKKLINIIKSGSRDEVKVAQKQVEKFWHDVYIPNRKEGRLAFCVFLDELKSFDQIKDVDHQAYFLNTIKWPLWSTGEKNFEEWADFLLTNIQHPSGKIRQAIIRSASYLVADLRLDMRDDFDIVKNKGLKRDEIKKIIENNQSRFGYFVLAVDGLIDKYYETKFNRYKYVSSLPVGVYKSLNILITEELLRSDYYKKIYNDFLNKLRAKRKECVSPRLTSEELANGRLNVEIQILALIKTSKSNLTIEDLKNLVYNENGQNCLNQIILKFDCGQDIEELNRVAQIITDAWNYWPHKRLDGFSPVEMISKLK